MNTVSVPVAFPLSTATNTSPFLDNPAFNVLIVNPPMRDVAILNYPKHPNAVRFISNAIVRALDKAGHITTTSQTGGEAVVRSNGPPTELKRVILDAVKANYGGEWKFEGDAKLVAPMDVLDQEERFYRDETTEPAHAYEKNPSDFGGVYTAHNPSSTHLVVFSIRYFDMKGKHTWENSFVVARNEQHATLFASWLKKLIGENVKILWTGEADKQNIIKVSDLKRQLSRNPVVADLPVEMAVYVPSTTDANVPLPESEVSRRVAETQTYLASLFGGHTTVAGKGGYVSDVKGLIAEPVIKVTAFASSEDWAKHRPAVEAWLTAKAKEWGQETIGFELEGDLKLVNPAFALPKAKSTVETVMQGRLATDLADASPFRPGIVSIPQIPHPKHRHELVKVGETNPDRRPVYRCELCKKYYSEAKK